ncbi:PH domain-containing protein [Halobacterium hubeiense]|uniref:PH domain-containing protein n=1 Tax=Halobacterium hubeiense TaxID=1407499 RepID=UPI001C4F6EBF|nr:PH domain-containing protein [Halobacterium hubeiense]
MTTKRIESDYLQVKPLIEVLEEDEQPQHFFFNINKGIQKDGEAVGDGVTNENRSLCLVTDQRVLLFANGNEGMSIPYTTVKAAKSKSGLTKAKLTIVTNAAEYEMYVSQNKDELDNAADYIQSQVNAADETDEATGLETIPDFKRIWDESDDEESLSLNERQPASDEPRGDYVTTERLKKIVDILDNDEVVHFLTRGSTVDVEGSGAGDSLFGDDRSRKSGTRGYVRAVVTDRRVAVKVPQFLGNDERSVPYSNITSVDLDTGLVNKRLTLQTPGQTYHIEAQEPGKDELRDITRFIRGKISEANQPDVVQADSSDPEPLEQLEKLKDLHDQGVVSDEEFEDKKSDLLDKI